MESLPDISFPHCHLQPDQRLRPHQRHGTARRSARRRALHHDHPRRAPVFARHLPRRRGGRPHGCGLGAAALSLAFTAGELVSTVEFKINYLHPVRLHDQLVAHGTGGAQRQNPGREQRPHHLPRPRQPGSGPAAWAPSTATPPPSVTSTTCCSRRCEWVVTGCWLLGIANVIPDNQQPITNNYHQPPRKKQAAGLPTVSWDNPAASFLLAEWLEVLTCARESWRIRALPAPRRRNRLRLLPFRGLLLSARCGRSLRRGDCGLR